MARDYSNKGANPIAFHRRGISNVFELQHRSSLEGSDIKIDSIEQEVKAVIQMHSNPINEGLEDKLLIVKKDECDFLRWGSIITGYGDNPYLVLTNPTSTDGTTIKSKIRELINVVEWKDKEEGQIIQFNTVSTRYLMYDDKTYTNDTKIFEEDDRIAIVIPINKYSSKLKMIDDVFVDNQHYKILKIDKIHDKTLQYENGIYQIVLIRTTFGEVSVNGTPIQAIVRFARMKDKVLNSKSRELITLHNQVKTGDYISHKYTRDDTGIIEYRNYIVRSLVDMKLEYDMTYIINCDAEFNMWDSTTNQIRMIPCYVEDNRTRFREDWKPNAMIDSSEYQIIVQENKLTSLLGEEVRRIILKGKAYEVVGTDNISLENAIYIGLKSSKIDPNADNLELGIADYDKMVNKPSEVVGDVLGEKEVFLGETYEYSIDVNGVVTWRIESNIEKLASVVEAYDNSCTIKINDNYKYVGETFTLKAYAVDELIDSIEINVMSW